MSDEPKLAELAELDSALRQGDIDKVQTLVSQGVDVKAYLRRLVAAHTLNLNDVQIRV